MTASTLAQLARNLYVSLQIDEKLQPEAYEIYIKPGFETAAWRFHGGKHRILIGDAISAMHSDLAPRTKQHCLYAYLLHELAHSLWTERDIPAIVKRLKEASLPFSLLNLFEDARIEEKMRLHLQRKFNWVQYEQLDTPQDPVAMFFFIVQCEHKMPLLTEAKKAMPPAQQQEFDTVFRFYKQALQASGTGALIELVAAWMEQFPDSVTVLEVMESGACLFATENVPMTISDEEFEGLLTGLSDALTQGADECDDATDDTSDDGSAGVPGADDDEAEHGDAELTTFQRHSLALSKRIKRSGDMLWEVAVPVAYDEQTAEALYQKMEEIFFRPNRLRCEPTPLPAKRLNIKALSQGSHRLYRKKARPVSQQKRITVIFDLSGSMMRTLPEMRLLLHVINTLAERRVISCNLILSGVFEKKAIFQQLAMPLQRKTLERIYPVFEGEGLHNTLTGNLPTLRGSDYVWIFTDGCITDDPIDRYEFNRYGLRTHAMYIGTTAVKRYLEDSFDHVICEEDVSALAEQVFTLIRA